MSIVNKHPDRIPNRAARKKLIASGIPLTVSMAILDDIDKFKSLALSFIANIQGLYFKRDDDIWNLRSNNPKITVR